MIGTGFNALFIAYSQPAKRKTNVPVANTDTGRRMRRTKHDNGPRSKWSDEITC